ncbi:MAG TPA: aspartate/glutamate racemase family protein [bacterium]|nr:aspartate/glutamate racemase family protein [bacterium]HPN44670.1 aspartate/glutamate racemase family protein [bacterium]
MQLLGLIGGTGWVSTVEYYRIINEETNRHCGGLNACNCILYSFNYAEIDALNRRNNLPGVAVLLTDAALKLQTAGAEGLVLCANTLHYFADELQKQLHIPIIHIADATAAEINRQGLTTIGLLGTKTTMEQDFYTKNLHQAGISTLIPESAERDFIHNAIMTELLNSDFRPATKSRFLEIIAKLHNRGAQGIVLGCTEIPLLIKQQDCDLPLFNTLEIHARAAVDFALG